eukprot:1188985-Prorocentrum_minimum.AAC.2
MREVHRMVVHGVTEGEMELAKATLAREAAIDAEQVRGAGASSSKNIPAAGTNRIRGERIYLWREPLAEGGEIYIPVAGTNHRRGERIYP